MAIYKKKVDKLTFYNGRIYQAGETVEFLSEDADVVKVHYGEKEAVNTPVKVTSERTPDPAASKVAETVRASKQATASE